LAETGRREERWNQKDHADRLEIVRALDNITNQLQSTTKEVLSVDEQRTTQENKKNKREWTLIIVTGAVVIFSALQWLILKKQLQVGNAASLSFTGVTLENFGGINPVGDAYWFFIPHIENSGNTPTQTLVLKMYFDLAWGMPKDDSAWETSHKNIATIQNTSVGPHVSITGYSVQVNGVFLTQLAANASSAYFMGEATYDDIFGWPHATQWCVQATVPIRDYSHGTTRKLFVGTAQCPAHNCIDKECGIFLRQEGWLEWLRNIMSVE
jgi:hypothetical protein